MSNTIGHGLLLPTVLKHQIKTSPSLLCNGFCGQRLTVRKSSLRRSCVVSGSTQAVLATDASSELGGRFKLQGDIEMQVDVKISSVALLEIQITNGTEDLYLHWGGTRNKNEKWVLPSRCPEGTKVFNNQALRTPFLKSGSVSLLKVEIDDPAIEAIEFLIVDERQDRWYKDNGQNFYVKFPKREKLVSNVGVPEDLVQIQAYLRWERNGKQTYTPEQEKKEFEEARKELQRELEKGNSLDDVRKKITKGETKTEVLKKLGKNIYRTPARITRKKRDVMQLLRKSLPVSLEEKISVKPKDLSALQIFSKTIAEQSDTNILNKKTYRLADKELLVLVTNASSKTGVHLATDMEGPLTLHWALSEKAGEWLVPPADLLPAGSISLDKAAETQFSTISVADASNKIQVFELYMEDGIFVGVPFVLRHGENWVKENDSDFYVEFTEPNKPIKDAGEEKGTAKDLLDKIASLESVAEQSFMHRFNIAADLIEEAKDADELGLAGILVWMRFMATRQLIWNKNYCVKPREISQAQDRLIDKLQNVYSSYPQYSELLRMIMSSVGRGGQGDVGQRIRDEILVIQKNNKCKGGMMEEWHQKLHNNTSPDDVVICQALMNYIKSDLDISVYWDTLNSNGITKERLLSYDRAIHNEPNFSKDQKEGLLRDLGNYLRTLKAVHSGADLESAISNCIGYISGGRGMVGVNIKSISGLASGFPELLQFVLEHVEDKNAEPLLEGLLEARQELKPLLSKSYDRLKDLLFLDIALDSTVRTAIERSCEALKNAKPEKIMYLITLLLENLILSSDNNEDLIYCWKGWNRALTMEKNGENDWALFAKSVLDRTRLALASKGELYHQLLQPSAEYLGALLGLDQWAVSIFTEEMIRSGSVASLSSLVNRIDPVLRSVANLGSWQVISPVEAVGYIVVVDELLSVQNKSYEKPTILVAKTVSGEEEIPDGTVAVLTPDMPDVLSHVSVRARNSKVCFATCFDTDILNDLRAKEGKLLNLKPTSADITYSEVKEETLTRSNNLEEVGPSSPVQLIKKQFSGRYAVSSEDFTSEMVGAKSRNIAYLKGKVPSFVGIPTSVALPFGVFKKVLSDELNQGVSEKLQILKKQLEADGSDVHGEIRKTVLDVSAPSQLVQELKNTMQSSEMPWPGDEGEQRWEQAWLAIKKVWASKWNERAYLSTKKVKLDHEYLCMAVLVQEIINADYAFVIHTTNPSSGDSSEIYAEAIISRSSAEAEYRGVANTVAETTWLRNLLLELHLPITRATVVYCDNVSAVYLSQNPVQHQRSKHIEIDIHFVREKVRMGSVKVLHVPADYQYADIFTKGLPRQLFQRFRSNLDSPTVLGYPSKPIGLFIRSIIFRSDSNGEDLEGYAGAGLYDSVPMDEEDKVVVDYSCDSLIIDFDFQKSILSSIARVGDHIEKLYGSPQDIEGVVRDGKIYVVQTRPQM